MRHYKAIAGFHPGQQIPLCRKSSHRHKTAKACGLGLLLIGSLLIARPAYALAFDTARWLNLTVSTQQPAVTAMPTHTLSTSQQAHAWQLTRTEWQRYNTLMNGVAGLWYATLNPPEILGLMARNEAERLHYATVVVRQRKARIDRELAFNRAIHQAWNNEYPTLKLVRPFDTRPFRVVKPAKH